jgi:non-canonical poly(A) RNA polymerase PAPD5/7
VVAFERIQFLLSFYNISIRLFGSCASGIAINNSDIDIAVDNSILSLYEYLPENLKLLGALESLEQVFASQQCFTYIKLIKTASIPVVKLTLDTSFEFLNPSYG